MIERDDYPSIPSRFERLIVKSSILDQIIAMKKHTRGTDKSLQTVQKKEKQPPVKGTIGSDPMFSGILRFAPAFEDDDHEYGSPWSEPLPAPLTNHRYFVSCEISQLQGAGPTTQLQGFRTLWTPPPGWIFVDGHGSILDDEAISNPLFIRRMVRSPLTTIGIRGFKVEVLVKYQP